MMVGGTMNKTEEAAIETFRSEGLLDALLCAARVLDFNVQKHGVKGWMRNHPEHHSSKARGHLSRPGRDRETKEPHPAHAVNRTLMVLALRMRELEEIER